MSRQHPTPTDTDDELLTMYLETETQFLAYMASLSTSASASSLITIRNSPILPALAPTDATTALATVSAAAGDDSTEMAFEPYHIRTLGEHNMGRLSILPVFPPDSLFASSASANITTTDDSSERPHLLLASVYLERFTDEQYERLRRGKYLPLFKLALDPKVVSNQHMIVKCIQHSYMWEFFQAIYVNTRNRLRVSVSIIDYNLKRLRQCLEKVIVQRGFSPSMLDFNEMGLALEFYLQIDVDLFFHKTCSFNNVVPRVVDNSFNEALFCFAEPEARFAITPCDKRFCQCCHSTCPRRFENDLEKEIVIPFSNPHIHRFVSGYEAILNCPATCETTDCIYVLTCPCGQFDFVGQTASSFATTLAHHREEGNRIIREFLIGETNIEYLTNGLKSIEKRTNDKLWLYQHSTRCSVAMQLFLDENPDYWCFVPSGMMGMNLFSADYQRSPFRRTTTTNENDNTWSSISEQPVWARNAEEVHSLMENVPKPPLGFTFSMQQRQEQAQFFKCAKDRIVPCDNPDLYNANIIAVLPKQSSELFRILIESLFITHAECKLNQIGNLLYEKSDPNVTISNAWYNHVYRRRRHSP